MAQPACPSPRGLLGSFRIGCERRNGMAMAVEWDAPSKATVAAYVRALTRRRREHTHLASEKQEMLDLFGRHVPEDAGAERREMVGHLAGQLAAARRRIESIDGLLARASRDPASLFLPVGAVVRMRPPARPETGRAALRISACRPAPWARTCTRATLLLSPNQSSRPVRCGFTLRRLCSIP